MKVISGGQTGVDQVALFVARDDNRLQTGGTAPKGWKTDSGPAPWLAQYGLVESWSGGYRVRTMQNVADADYTVWFGRESSQGAILTIGTCHKNGKPYVCNPTPAQLIEELERYDVQILNCAGNRLRTYPESSDQARRVLSVVFERWRR